MTPASKVLSTGQLRSLAHRPSSSSPPIRLYSCYHHRPLVANAGSRAGCTSPAPENGRAENIVTDYIAVKLCHPKLCLNTCLPSATAPNHTIRDVPWSKWKSSPDLTRHSDLRALDAKPDSPASTFRRPGPLPLTTDPGTFHVSVFGIFSIYTSFLEQAFVVSVTPRSQLSTPQAARSDQLRQRFKGFENQTAGIPLTRFPVPQHPQLGTKQAPSALRSGTNSTPRIPIPESTGASFSPTARERGARFAGHTHLPT
ncbi:hypothetical protein VDGL01_03198 [Verticillium dahliae]